MKINKKMIVGLSAALVVMSASIDAQISQREAQKRYIEEQAKKWPNLSGRRLREHLAILADNPLSKNKKLNEYVQNLGERVLANTPHRDRDYRFLVLDSEEINAFVTGTDYVYIHRGIIALFQSEAQLAGVIGHEIAHNVANHRSRMEGRQTRDGLLASFLSILAGSTSVGNAVATEQFYNQFKYKRSLEEEADRLGAQYLYASQYDTNGLIDGLGTMFDATSAALNGQGGPQYRELFGTHPRQDRRLRLLLSEVGELPPGEEIIGRAEYREALTDMVYGPNLRPNAPEGYVRYNNESLGITFLHPETWDRTVKGAKIIIKDPKKTMQFKVEIEKTVNKTQSTEDAIKEKFPEDLSGIAKINPQSPKDLGVVAVRPNQRVGLVKVARNTFHFQGITRDNNLTKEIDDVFLGMIASFRRIHPRDKSLTHLKRIYFEQLLPGETFASIAQDKEDDNVASEVQLRVINGYYPRGEAEPGTWIKKIRRVKVDQNSRDAKTADGKLTDSEEETQDADTG